MTELISINTKGLIPNHLNDTNIFCRYATNTIIEVEPKEVHFAGYKLNERNYQEIKFTNISDEISRFHIIPPVSKYFRLKYNKPERMVPGFYVKCTIIFTPDKARNYNDFIKIHTKDSENNIIVPIYAYPAITGLQIPRNIKFPVTPIGKNCQKHLRLHSDSEIDFNYEIVIVRDHPSISIDPMTGVIPGNSETLILLQFHPTDYSTCEKTINIYVSQYNFKPIICTLTGTSDPGLERKLLLETTELKSQENSDLISISKLELKRKSTKPTSNAEANTELLDRSSNQKVSEKTFKKQLKSEFESRVRENVVNEKQNQLRWQTCRGFQPISNSEIEIIKENREKALKENNLRLRQITELADCYKESNVISTNWTRTIRLDSDDKDFDFSVPTPQFVPECWMVRRSILDHFRSAAWKVIINTRLKVRLRKLIESGGNDRDIDNSHLYPGGEQLTFYRPLNGISEERLPYTQLTFDNSFDMSEYKLLLPVEPKYRFLDLVVPLQMQVLNYERVDTSSLCYQIQKSEFKMKSTPTTEATVVMEDDAPVSAVVFARKSDSFPLDRKDNTLVAFPHNCSYFDNHSYFPMYYYRNELLEDVDPVEMDWKVPKSPFLTCKKMIKSGPKDRLIVKAYESCLMPENAPDLMTKADLKQLDYSDSSNAPVIDSNMMYEEFPILLSFKETLAKKWGK